MGFGSCRTGLMSKIYFFINYLRKIIEIADVSRQNSILASLALSGFNLA